MLKASWLYLYDGKLKGVGIDLVAEQQLRAFAEVNLDCELVSRGTLALPAIRNRSWPFPPTKLLSWLDSQDYYAVNKRFFSILGRHYFSPYKHQGVIAWSKSAFKLFQRADKAGVPRLLNVGNFHCDFDAGGKIAPQRWPRIGKERLRQEYAMATKILVASDYAAHTFIAQGISAEKLEVIYRGVDAQRFSPKFGKADTPFIVASCGLLGERKGTYELLKSWKMLALPDAELWLIGSIPKDEEAALRQLASPSVRFLGFRRDLPLLLAQAHAHVLLSRNEGFAKVLLEAAASGVLNVCTAETGWPTNGVGAVLVKERKDIDEVASVLEKLYRDRDYCFLQGLAARTWVENNFTWQHFRTRFSKILKSI